MRLLERDDGAGLEGDDVDVHVVRHVVGLDEARRAPAVVGAGHPADGDILFVGDEGFWDRNAVDGFVGFADPMEADRSPGLVGERPFAAGGQVGVAAGAQGVGLAVDLERRLAGDDEQHAFGAGVGFGRGAAAAGRHVHDVLREGLGEAGHGAGDDPGARVGPMRQGAGDDIAHDAVRDQRIGLGEDGPLGVEGRLRRKPVDGAGVGGRGHCLPTHVDGRPAGLEQNATCTKGTTRLPAAWAVPVVTCRGHEGATDGERRAPPNL